MSKKYHITPTQRILECNNPENCPFGADTPHFDSEKEAEAYRDANKKDMNGPLPMFVLKGNEERNEIKKIKKETEEKINAINKETEERVSKIKKEAEERIYVIARKIGRWHVDHRNRVKPCYADYGDCTIKDHFDSEKEAEEYREKMQKERNRAMYTFE